MDPQQRKKMLFAVALVGGLGYLVYDYVYSPRAEAVAELEQRLESLETQNRAARALMENEGRSEVESRLALYREQLDRVEGLIPSSEELPDLLDAISAEAQRTGVQLTLIQPVSATAEEFYTRRTYDLAVRGTYHEIGDFLAEIGSLPRIVTPIGLRVTLPGETAGDSPELDARFSIETYVLPSEDPSSDTSSHVE